MALTYTDPVTWTSGSHLNVASWDEAAAVTKSASDSLLPALTEGVSRVTAIDSAADALAAAITDTSRAIVKTGLIQKAASDTLHPTCTDTGTRVIVTPKSATDTLHPISTETRQISGGPVTAKSGSDALPVSIVEAPTTSRIIDVDETVPLAVADDGTQPQANKVSADTLAVSLGESWSIIAGGGLILSDNDALTVGITDTVRSLLQVTLKTASDVLAPTIVDVGVNKFLVASDALAVAIVDTSRPIHILTDQKFASDTLVTVITETSNIAVPIVKTASDVLAVAIVDASRPVSIFEAPPAGVLPPGWTEQELSELAGIARPWRINPNNVTPIQGWMPRKYWAVYDESGRLVATDRWRDVARGKAWTAYHSGRWAA